MLTDWELWAVAHRVVDEQGERAPLFVASRIGSLAAAGDEAGVTVWKEVARRIARLAPPPRDLHS